MSNDYYEHDSGAPGSSATLSSAQIRAEFDLVAAGFSLLPDPDQINSGATNSATTTGSANAYLASIASVTAYEDKQRYTLKINVTNTGASTLNVSGIGTRTIKRLDGSGLEAGDLMTNRIYDFAYNATDGSVELMTLMPDLVQSSNPTYDTITAEDAIIVPVILTPPAAVTVNAGNVTFNLDVATVFELTAMSSDCTATFVATDLTRAYSATVIVTTTGAFTFTDLLMPGVTRFKRSGLARLLKPSGTTVVGIVYSPVTQRFFYIPAETEAV